MSTDTDNYADQIGLSDTYERPKRLSRKFKAWHRPRKQYVRRHQWLTEINALIDQTEDLKTLRYLGLPGDDLLDLRYFHDAICKARSLTLRFLGFNDKYAPNTDAHISLDEVRRLPLVAVESDVAPDTFAAISDINSVAWAKAKHGAPYHIISIDLCNGFAQEEPGGMNPTLYRALRRLISLQARYNGPWLLLLTTRAGLPGDTVHHKAYETLLDKYAANLISCEQFQELSEKLLGISTEQELREAAATAAGSVVVFLLGLCKWVFSISAQLEPPLQVELRDVIGYQINKSNSENDIFSIVLKFDPSFALKDDPFDLSGADKEFPNECDMASAAIEPLNLRTDADKILSSDKSLYDEMVEESCNLLELARYDKSEYMEWIQSF